jgi:hypothetical protein
MLSAKAWGWISRVLFGNVSLQKCMKHEDNVSIPTRWRGELCQHIRFVIFRDSVIPIQKIHSQDYGTILCTFDIDTDRQTDMRRLFWRSCKQTACDCVSFHQRRPIGRRAKLQPTRGAPTYPHCRRIITFSHITEKLARRLNHSNRYT